MSETATAETVTTKRKGGRPLTKHDRCDRCGAAAGIEVRSGKTGLALLFCQHHAKLHADALAEWIVIASSDVK